MKHIRTKQQIMKQTTLTNTNRLARPAVSSKRSTSARKIIPLNLPPRVTTSDSQIPNLDAIKAKQKATWEAGDFGQIARSIENVAEEFMAQQPLKPGLRVLDAACGTGNLAVLAAKRGCDVQGVDIARNLIEQAR